MQTFSRPLSHTSLARASRPEASHLVLNLWFAALRHSTPEWLNVGIQLDALGGMHPYSGANSMGTCTPTP